MPATRLQRGDGAHPGHKGESSHHACDVTKRLTLLVRPRRKLVQQARGERHWDWLKTRRRNSWKGQGSSQLQKAQRAARAANGVGARLFIAQQMLQDAERIALLGRELRAEICKCSFQKNQSREPIYLHLTAMLKLIHETRNALTSSCCTGC